AEEAARLRDAEEKKLLAEVEAEFIGKGALGRDSILSRWRHLASRSIPDIRNARSLWERDERDPEANAWRATRSAIEAYTGDLSRAAGAINRWYEAHPVQAALLWAGLKKKPADLRQLEHQHADRVKFLEASQRRLQEHEENWVN